MSSLNKSNKNKRGGLFGSLLVAHILHSYELVT